MSDSAGYIYLLKGDRGRYRIGRTNNPKQRAVFYKWYSANNNYGLTPLYLVFVGKHIWAEKCMHNIFDEYRTNERHNGMGPRKEWFVLPDKEIYTFENWANVLIETFGGSIHKCNGWKDFAEWSYGYD